MSGGLLSYLLLDEWEKSAGLPKINVKSLKPPGLRGPKGMGVKSSWSKSNTAAPSIPDAGASLQKSLPPPKVAHVKEDPMKMTGSPTVQDFVKAAMVGSAARASASLEAMRQTGSTEKVASASPPQDTERVSKLAHALDYLSENLDKVAEIGESKNQPGTGPNALKVMEATSSNNEIEAGQTGHSTQSPPMSPKTEKDPTKSGDPGTAMETDYTNRPGGGAAYPEEPIKNEKTAAALAQKNLSALQKIANRNNPVARLTEMLKLKQAADENNPAQISSGKDNPPDASASEEGVPSEPSDVNKQKKMVSSNDSAIDYTKGQAKADPKSDVSQVLHEAPLSSSTDKVLNQALDHTGEAGVKISSVKTLEKRAAARVLLQKLAEADCGSKEDEPKKDEGKKEKKSMGAGGYQAPGVTTNPSSM